LSQHIRRSYGKNDELVDDSVDQENGLANFPGNKGQEAFFKDMMAAHNDDSNFE